MMDASLANVWYSSCTSDIISYRDIPMGAETPKEINPATLKSEVFMKKSSVN
jgi:hypothetical protein